MGQKLLWGLQRRLLEIALQWVSLISFLAPTGGVNFLFHQWSLLSSWSSAPEGGFDWVGPCLVWVLGEVVRSKVVLEESVVKKAVYWNPSHVGEITRARGGNGLRNLEQAVAMEMTVPQDSWPGVKKLGHCQAQDQQEGAWGINTPTSLSSCPFISRYRPFIITSHWLKVKGSQWAREPDWCHPQRSNIVGHRAECKRAENRAGRKNGKIPSTVP